LIPLPWLELAILLPLLGAVWVRRIRDAKEARRHSLVICGLALVCTLAAFVSFKWQEQIAAHGRWQAFADLLARSPAAVDVLNAPLLPLVSLLFLLTVLGTLRTKGSWFSFPLLLVSETLVLAALSCRQPWILVGLLAAGTIPPWVELHTRRMPTRVYTVHMTLFIVLLIAGQALMSFAGGAGRLSVVASTLLMMAVLVRGGIAPAHCWMTDLFEHASLGTSLLFVTPMVGAYAAVRLVLPVAPEWVLHGIAILSLVTALYAAAMALVQRDARRFFGYLFLSHSSLVFVGLETATPIGLTGALCVWLSVGLSLAGFGLTLRSIEARVGRLSLDRFHGLYGHIPSLAGLFLLTGLASIGFPGTAGFVGAELLVEGAVQVSPFVGIAIVVAAALNGLAVLHAYFRIFTGSRHVASIDLRIRVPERVAVLVLSALLVGGGLYPQPGVAGRYNAAAQLVRERDRRLGDQAPAAVASRDVVRVASSAPQNPSGTADR
jgi:NADH-quinone oxidoreductase subunit M